MGLYSPTDSTGKAVAPAARPGLDLAGAAGAALVAIAIQWPLRDRAFSLVDEGLVVQVADDLLQGRRLYADAVAYAWPGAFWVTAAAFALFGTSFETARAVAVGAFAVAAAVAYLIARWTTSRCGAALVVLGFLAYRVWAYPHWQMVNYSPLAMTAALVAVWLSGVSLAGGGTAVAAGMAAGVAAACKQDLGLATAGALGLVLWAVPDPRRVRRALGFAAGALMVLGACAIVLAAQGVVGDCVRETVLAPLHAVRRFDYPGRPALWPFLAQDADLRAKGFSYLPSVLVDLYWPAIVASRVWRETAIVDVGIKLVFHLHWLVPLLALPLAVRDLRGRDGAPPERPLLLLVAASAAAVAAFNRPHDWVHLLVLYPPALLLLAALAARAAARGERLGRAVRLGAVALVLGVSGLSAWLAYRLIRLHDTPVRSARGTVYGPARQAHALEEILKRLAVAPPSTPLASWPYHPLLNFLSARPPLSRHYILWPVDRNPRRDAEIIAALHARPHTEIVYSPMQVPHYPRPSTYAAELFAHLAAGWQVERVVGGEPGGFTFLHAVPRRTPARGRTLRPDFLAAPLRLATADGAVHLVPDEERARLVSEVVWPFHRVLRMATRPGVRTQLALPLVPRPGERFEAVYGTNPDYLGAVFAPGARFAVTVEDAERGEEVRAFEADCDPARDPASRGWRPVTVDLDRWRDRPVTLVLEVGALVPAGPERLDVAGWADPRLVPAEPAAGSESPEPQRGDVPGALRDVAGTELREAPAAIHEDDRDLAQTKPQAMRPVLHLDQERIAAPTE